MCIYYYFIVYVVVFFFFFFFFFLFFLLSCSPFNTSYNPGLVLMNATAHSFELSPQVEGTGYCTLGQTSVCWAVCSQTASSECVSDGKTEENQIHSLLDVCKDSIG